MDVYTLPPIETLSTLPTTELVSILDHLFEPCVPLHTLSLGLLRDHTFASYDDCIANIGIQLTNLAESTSTSDRQWLESILEAHPRLGEKRIESTQSQGEQAQLTANVHGRDKLAELNASYESTFPGLRCVVFVDGRDRAIILKDMQARIDRNNAGLERLEAIKAMVQIAADRARKLQC